MQYNASSPPLLCCMYPLDDGVLLIRLSVVAVAYILGSSAMGFFLLLDKLVGGFCPPVLLEVFI